MTNNFISFANRANTPPVGFKHASRILAVLLVLLTFGVGQMWGAPSVVSYNESTKDTETSVTSSNITSGTAGRVSWSATGATWHSKKSRWDIAVDGTITFSVSSGYQITQIVFTTTSNKGTFSVSPTATITGNGSSPCTISGISASSVTVTVSGQTHMINSSVTVTYEEASSSKTLSSISVQTAPTKKKYVAGEMFDPTGLVITRTYSDATSDTYAYAGHTSDFTFSPTTSTALTTSNTSVSITYGGKSTSQAINVYNVTMQARDEDGNTIPAGGPGAPSRTGKSISPAADANNYVFKEWQVTNADLGSSATTKANTITNPTEAVTVTAVYYKPITITYKANGQDFTTQTYGYGGTLAFPASGPNGDTYSCTGKTFTGWVAEANKDYSNASTAPTYVTAGGSVTAAATYYAVFATSGGGGGASVNTVVFSENFGSFSSGDKMTGSMSSSTGNRVVYGGGSVTYSYKNGTSADTKIYVANNAGGTSPELLVGKYSSTFTIAGIPNGGASELTLSYKQNGQSLTSSVSGTGYSGGKSSNTSGTTSTTITVGSGTTFNLTFTGPSGNNNARLDDIEIKVKTQGTSYSNFETNCCTPLAQVEGSITLSNADCGAGELKAKWKMEATTGIASQVLHVYDADNDNEVTASKIINISASTENQTQTITGLTPCHSYYVKVENISSGGSYCGDGWAGEKSASATTKGYTYSFTLTDNHVTKTAGTEKATTCDGDIEYTFEAVSGWVLPEDITVTNADEGWLWDDSEGTLFIDASKVTGNVEVTIEATAAPCEPMVAPSVTATPTYNGATLNWGAVEHASKYKVYIYTNEDVEVEKDENVTSTTYTVSSPLTKQTTYKYRVDAVSEDEASYCSSFKAGTFTTADYPTVTLYYSENGELSEGVEQKILTDFTLPNEAAECSKTFIGWTTQSSYSHASEAPDPFYEKGATFQIPTNANCTLYAVYADVVEGSTSWDATAISSLGASDVFVIVGNNGSNYAMTNDNGTSSAPAATAVTISNDAITSEVADKLQWNISGNATNGYTFYPKGSTTTWLYCTDANNGVRVGTNANKTFKPDNDGYLKNDGTSRYVGVYNSQDWRCYDSHSGNSNNIKGQTFTFYKKNVTEALVTNYVTICQGKVAKPVISGVAEGTTYEEAKTITITSATNGATIYYTTDGTEPTTSSNAYSAPFEVSANGDYTIRAIAVKDEMVNSDEATAVSFTLDLPFTTIASFIAAAPTNKKLVFTAESNARVLAYNKNRIYIQDGTGAMFLYNTGTNSEGHGKTWASGKKIVGTLTGTYSLTNNMPRMTVTDFGATDVTADAIELPTPIEVEALATNFASNVCKLVTISGVSIRSESVADNNTINMIKSDVTYNIYNAFNALTSHTLPLNSTSCTVTGILGQSNGNTLQLMPISADAISTNGAEAVLPVLSATGSTNSAEPFEVATNKVISFTPNSNFSAVYAVNDGEETAVTGSSNVTITDEENATKVYIKATREYYTTKEVSYYYRANSALIEYDITKGAMSHGSATIQNAQGDAITYAVGGATVTLVANPAEHYHWVSWNVTAGGEPVTVTNNTFEMPNAAVTVSATFEEDDYATVAFAKGNASVTGDAPASQKVYVGENVTMPGKGSMILSSHNFAGWKLGSNAVLNTGDAYTVTAADHEAGTITFEAQWEPYPWASAGKWELVTSASEITVNPTTYVIFADTLSSGNTACGLTQNDNNRSTVSVTKADNLLTWTGADPAIFIVEEGKDEGTFAFYDAINNNYIHAASDSKNYLHSNTNMNTDGAAWTIDAIRSNGGATVTADTYTHNLLNLNGNICAAYLSSHPQTGLAIYKFVGGSYYNIVYAKGTEDVVRNMPEGHVTDENGEAAIKENTPIRVGYTFTGWKDQDENVYTYNDGHVYAFTKNVTLTAQWEEQTDKYTVSYDANGSSDAVPAEAAYFENAEVTVAGAVSKEGFVFMGWECNGRVYTAGSRFYMPAADMPMVAKYAHGATYVVETKTSVTTEGSVPEGSSATFVNTNNTPKQITKDNTMTLTLSGYTGYTIKGVQLNAGTNNSSGKGTLSITIGGNEVATGANADKWYDGNHHYGTNNGTDFESVLVSMNPKTVKYGEDIVITIAASENSLYCQSFTILYDLLPVEVENTTTIEARDLAAGTAVTIHDGGTLNVNADKTLDNLTVEAGGKVDGSGNLTVNDFTIEGQDGKSGQVMNADKLTINGDAYFDFTLAVSGTTAANQWHNFSVPFPVSVMDGVYNAETGAKLTNEVDYAIEDYHGDLRAQGKYGWKKYRGIMQPGITYSMTVNGDIQTFRFKKVAGAYSFDANPSVGFSQHNSGVLTDAGWNGLGNMRLCYASVNNENILENGSLRYVQILDATEYAYKSYAVGEINLTVGSAFFIQAANNGTMTFAAAHNAPNIVYAPARTEAKRTDKPIAVTLSNENQSDRMYITASEDAKSEYQIGCDLQKMFATNTPQAPMIYSVNYGGIKLAAEEAPIVNDKASYALSLYVPADGTYRIETPTESDNADLYLTKDGRVIWNLSMNGYEVELTKGTTEGYGLLLVRKAPSTATGVEEVESQESKAESAEKVIIDEHVYILRGGQMYDVTGKAVK